MNLTCRVMLSLSSLAAGTSALCQPVQPNRSGIVQHPCVLVTPEDITRLRVLGADNAVNRFGVAPAKIWAGLKAKADRFVAAPPYHYEVQIPANGDQPSEKWEYTLSDADPPLHPRTTWYPPWTAMFQERDDAITTRLKHLSFAFLMTGERNYFEAARDIALHLSHWTTWTDPSYGGGNLKCCLDTGHAAQNVAVFYDWCHDSLTPEERELVRTALVERGVKAILAGVDVYPPDTNGFAVLTCGLGLAGLALRAEAPEAAEWLTAAVEKTRKSLSLHGRDGGAYEGPGYGTYLLDSFAVFLNALEAAKVDHDLFLHPFLATMNEYCSGLLSLDTKTQPCFGDGSPTQGYRKMMHLLARRGRGCSAAAWYLQQINALTPTSVDEFVVFDASKLQPELPTFNPSRPFVDIGEATLRDGYNPNSAFVALKAGPPDRNIGHNHYDHNSFVLSYLGDWLVCDRGYHHFTHPPSTKFTLGTMGHSSLVLDRDDAYLQRTLVPDFRHDQIGLSGARITRFFSSPVYDFAKGEAMEVYNKKDSTVLDRFDRSLFFIKPNILVVRDLVSAPAPHRFSILLAAEPSAEVTVKDDGFLTTLRAAELESHVWATAPLQYAAALYPQAEQYGPYLESQTPAVQSVEFTSVLLPRAIPNPALIRNGSFERGLLGWTIRANEDAPNHSADSTVAFEGKQSGRVERSGYFYSQHSRLPVGAKLKVKAAVLTRDTTQGAASICIYFWRAGTAFDSKRLDSLRPASWTEYTIEATVPEGTDEICVALNYFGNGVGWFDAVRVESEAATKAPPVALPVVKRLREDGSQFEVAHADKRIAVVCGLAGLLATAKTSRGLVECDGEFSLIEWSNRGSLLRLALHQGTVLKLDGQPLIALAERASCALSVAGRNVEAVVTTDITPHAPLREAKLTLGKFARGRSVSVNRRLF